MVDINDDDIKRINNKISNLYALYKATDNEARFKYIGIIIGVMAMISNVKIGLNIVLGLVIAYALIRYNHDKNIHDTTSGSELFHKKAEQIIPEIRFKKYPDIVDFIFSIQDFYNYNPEAFEETIANINSFIKLYEDSKIVTRFCENNYQIAESKVRNALNSIHSVTLSLNDQKEVFNKLTKAHKKLNIILKRYLKEMFQTCEDTKITDGYNVETKILDFDGPKAHNLYNPEEGYTYEFY